MIEELENTLDYHDRDGDHHDDENSISEMFRSASGLLDSLDKLTDELNANLVSDEEPGSVTCSNESSSNDDEEFCWDDDDIYYSGDEDPDSGENTLFSTMDDLVTELMMELKDDSCEEDGENSQPLDRGIASTAAEIANETNKDDDRNVTECDSYVTPSPACTPSENCVIEPSTLHSSRPAGDRVEVHMRVHQQVKALLQQVTELTIQNDRNEGIGSNIERKIEQGDLDDDRLKHLLGTIATCSNLTIFLFFLILLILILSLADIQVLLFFLDKSRT